MVTAHMERFPDAASGLGCLEAAILEALQEAPLDGAALFQAAGRGPVGRRLGLGDLQFFAMVQDLQAAQALKLTPATGLPRHGQDARDAGCIQTAITPRGLDLLAGRGDRFAAGAPEIWLGGYRLPADGGRWRRQAGAAGPELIRR
jgi:hypothetical protein